MNEFAKKKIIINTNYKKMNEIIEKKRKNKEKPELCDMFSNNYQDKVKFYEKLIQETMLSIQKYKFLDIITANELSITINNLEQVIEKLSEVDTLKDKNSIAEKLQNVNDSLFDVFKQFGTSSVNDLLTVSFGNNFINKIKDYDKYKIIEKYVNALSFKILTSANNAKKTPLVKNKIIEDFMIAENSNNFECFDLGRTTKIFQLKVYGIKIAIRNKDEKKVLILNGLTKDLILSSISDKLIKNKIEDLKLNKPEENDYNSETFNNFIESLSIKDLLIYNNEEIYFRFAGTINQLNLIKQKNISQVVKDFLTSELYSQRRTIINLLIADKNAEFQYLAYLLYDLMSNDINGNIDTHEQTCLFDSLPWNIKKKFRLAMKQTIQYTNKLTNFDSTKIPLEQQICLLKANDTVKEKAMVKLKEVKAKTDDSGSKARQYLEGLLKIPFGVYVKEPVLSNMKIITSEVDEMKLLLKNITNSDCYDSINSYNLKDTINKNLYENINKVIIENIFTDIKNKKRNDLINIISHINKHLKNTNCQTKKIIYSGIKQSLLKKKICDFILKNKNNNNFIENFIKDTDVQIYEKDKIINLYQNIKTLSNRRQTISNYMSYTKNTLETAVHGHSYAKRQIERIIGQWITGEMDGYCFGFEGPPGVGKTSLAQKGISKCLLDQNNVPRPFCFIAVGGSSNGSTFEGHNYTYVGSTWGKIVDVLIESKCMNPIIFIDELDKISKTEHGKEIVGILTHLIDPSQNKGFQDKYFSGIELDLSKALFIFSYNNAEIIDKILLDRIHRIKFKHLTIEEKITITNDYLLPELYTKMGINNYIKLTDDVISFIINEYTYEAGVRNLKQHLFDIIGEINLNLLLDNFDKPLPYLISTDDVKNVYLKEKNPIRPTLIHNSNSVGIINGLWANSSGKGGIIQIETNFFASNTLFELKLTGSQGDVMKESMNVAKTLAWNSIDNDTKKTLMKRKETSNQGIHIHCPEGSVPKDGPSAGTAITVALFSLFTNKKIKHDFAITGEISLQGNVTEIGGLDLKIIGGIQGGVKSFIYPEKNKKDFKEFMEKYKNKDIIKNIKFYPVNTFDEVLKLILV